MFRCAIIHSLHVWCQKLMSDHSHTFGHNCPITTANRTHDPANLPRLLWYRWSHSWRYFPS